MRFISGIVIALLLTLTLSACGEKTQENTPPPDVHLSVRVEPEPLTVGEAILIVNLQDTNGNPIDGATIQAHGDMDHEGMVPVDSEASESINGEYRVPFMWSMGGGWIVTITAQLPDDGGEVSENFEYFVEAVSSESVINQHGGMNMSEDDPAEQAINIAYEPDNDPAVAGEAEVTITLTDDSGEAITDAKVSVIGDMDHAGMMPINAEGEHTEDGKYRVPLTWTMAGAWHVTVTVIWNGTTTEKTFDQQVVR